MDEEITTESEMHYAVRASYDNDREMFDRMRSNIYSSSAVPSSYIDYLQSDFTDKLYPWSKVAKSSRRSSSKRDNIKTKDKYSLEECLDCFDDLLQKDLGEVYLCGAVALFLQGKITRTEFSDLDIFIDGKYDLDDDIYDNPRAREYDQSRFKRRAVIYNGVKICIFNTDYPSEKKIIPIRFMDRVYMCESYESIIHEKLEPALRKIKDIEELLGKSFKIEYI